MKFKAFWFNAVCLGVVFIMTAGVVLARGSQLGSTSAPAAVDVTLGTGFTYQGQLNSDGAPYTGVCDMQFGLWDDVSAGAQQGITQTVTISVTNGLFTVLLNGGNEFGANAFNGTACWLGLAVRCPAGGGSYTALAPRQPLTPAPFAFALPGLYTQQNATSPNLIGGHSSNSITAGAVGATISGGGNSDYTNDVTDDYGTIGGGINNQAGNNTGTTGDRAYATVGGGVSNTAAGYAATASGGSGNSASGYAAANGGGVNNIASGSYTGVGGGNNNVASGNYATVPGGISNSATTSYTLAAGRRAKANHEGAFVWGDATDADVASTATNQFVVRASNGLVLRQNAGESKVVNTGEYYRDNSIIAWGRVSSGGTLLEDYGVASVSHSTGIYTITLTAFTANADSLIPSVTPVRASPPTSAASARLISIYQYGFNTFLVYVTNGSYALADTDFVFLVTGR